MNPPIDNLAFERWLASQIPSREEKFRMLCLCQGTHVGCSAITGVGSGSRAAILLFFLGESVSPHCGRGGNQMMEGGVFKGRKYCWQHYPLYAICDTCLNYESSGRGLDWDVRREARMVYVWEFHPQRIPPFRPEDRGRLMLGPPPEKSLWGERLLASGEWLLQKSLWLCDPCTDAFAERMQRGNKKLRKALIKEAQALIEGRQTLTEIKRLLKEKKKGVTVENMQGYS